MNAGVLFVRDHEVTGGSSLCEKVMLRAPTWATCTMTTIYDDTTMQTMQSVPTIPASPVPVPDAVLEEGGAADETPRTPHQSPRSDPECPAAPARLRMPPALLMPQLSDHQGQGILAGDFIKPDPVLTRQETRRYVVAELERWLTGRICVHAKEIDVVYGGGDPAEVALLVAAGRWPAARLWLVLEGLKGVAEQVGLPADYEERFHWVGRWAANVCADHLRGYEAIAPAAQMAVGFVTTDLLPGGRTIDSFWNHSPFEALRAAAPLPDRDPVEALHAAAPLPEAEAEAEAETNGPVGIDEQLDRLTLDVTDFLKQRISVSVPLWAPLAFFGGFTAYLWLIVAVFVSR